MKTSRTKLQQHYERPVFIHRWRTMDPEKWMATSGQGNTSDQSLCCCYTPGDNWKKYQLFIHWTLNYTEYLTPDKIIPGIIAFYLSFFSIKWSGHYQLMPLFSLLLSQMNVMWFLHLVNKCDIYKAERETVKNSTWWEVSHFNGLLFGTLVLFSLTTQQTSLLGNCYNSAWCVSICEGFFPAILLSTVVFVS